MILGIDAGLNGALALYQSDPTIIEIIDVPTLTKTVAGKTRREIDTTALARWFDNNASRIKHCCIERPEPMLKLKMSGGSSMSLGDSFGVLRGMAAANFIPISYAKPSAWKKRMGLTKDKDVSRRIASERFPEHAMLWNLKKHDGRAEALLLAVYSSQGN